MPPTRPTSSKSRSSRDAEIGRDRRAQMRSLHSSKCARRHAFHRTQLHCSSDHLPSQPAHSCDGLAHTPTPPPVLDLARSTNTRAARRRRTAPCGTATSRRRCSRRGRTPSAPSPATSGASTTTSDEPSVGTGSLRAAPVFNGIALLTECPAQAPTPMQVAGARSL